VMDEYDKIECWDELADYDLDTAKVMYRDY
jgi:hypothetical protein